MTDTPTPSPKEAESRADELTRFDLEPVPMSYGLEQMIRRKYGDWVCFEDAESKIKSLETLLESERQENKRIAGELMGRVRMAETICQYMKEEFTIKTENGLEWDAPELGASLPVTTTKGKG